MNRKERAKQINKFFQMMSEKMDLSDDEKLEISDLFEEYKPDKTYSVGKTLKQKDKNGNVTLVKVLEDKTLKIIKGKK